MKVLLIDDNDQQLVLAKAAAEKMGWEAVVENPKTNSPGLNYAELRWSNLMKDVDGVVTDLMWEHRGHGLKPNGILVVVHALWLGKPVVICTNSGDFPKGHHGEAISFIHDGYLTSVEHICDDSPFGWEEDKRWELAMHQLAKRIAK
jgi:hypothetical protein